MSDLKNTNLNVASYALDCVQNSIDIFKQNDEIKKYKTLVKKISTLIQSNGFINTLAFVLSKCDLDKKEEKKIYKKIYNNKVLYDILLWNYKNEKIKNLIDFRKYKINTEIKDDTYLLNVENIINYIKAVTDLNQLNYRLITKEMIDLFGWIKRFADGMIEGEE